MFTTNKERTAHSAEVIIMLYDEFVKGTGCKENEHNYKVYKELEIIYMNTDCTKEHIYEMGKKLVDNSKSEKAIEIESKVNAEIKELKDGIDYYKREIERYEFLIPFETDAIYLKDWKGMVKYYKDEIRKCRNKIRELKWVIE